MGNMNSNSGGEGDIRRNMIEDGIVDCMVALPSQLFYNTMIPACLWFLAHNRVGSNGRSPLHENEQQTIALTAIRDTLLPKLMNGEIMV